MLDFHVHFALTRSRLCVTAKKRPRKPKGAPADDVALAKLRPRHSHNSGDVGERDVIMSTEGDTHVGSSGSQIYQEKSRARRISNRKTRI